MFQTVNALNKICRDLKLTINTKKSAISRELRPSSDVANSKQWVRKNPGDVKRFLGQLRKPASILRLNEECTNTLLWYLLVGITVDLTLHVMAPVPTAGNVIVMWYVGDNPHL